MTNAKKLAQKLKGKKVFVRNPDGRLMMRGLLPRKFTVIAGFKDWLWCYWKDSSTYHWEIVYYKDIQIIK